jgi:5-(hydroxymethyl)furfural/furfural oxidase
VALDTVIVGAGSAGAPLAALLSHDPNRSVLLIEAGPDYRSGETPDEIRGANFGPAIGLGTFHWTGLTARMTEQQQPGPYLQGLGVGGSSAINGQGAVRGRPGDFDGWAANGCAGWSWRDVLPAFVGIEDDLDFGDRSYHGTGGPIPVSRCASEAGAVSEGLRDVALGWGHPEHADMNAPDSAGVSTAPWNRRAGARVSTNDAYLEGARGRGNLRIMARTLVTRVIVSGGRAIGVEVSTPDGRQVIEAGEVILCAGAVHSPAILMRSGIGAADGLRRLGIDVVADLPGVGRNLQDHPMMWLTFPLREEVRTSFFALPGHFVLRFAASAASGAEPGDDLEIFPLDRSNFNPADGGLMVSLMSPRSRGRVGLSSPDPAVEPTVDLRMLADGDDLGRLREGTRYAARAAAEPVLSKLMEAPVTLDGRQVDDFGDDELDACLRSQCKEYYHTTGTCRMGGPSDPDRVVDLGGRVLGVAGLRVVDASIMPTLPKAPTHLTTVMIADRIGRTLV